MVDLTVFEDLQRIQDEGRFFPVLDAAGNLTDMRVKVAGPDSDVQRKAQQKTEKALRDLRSVSGDISDDAMREAGLEALGAAVLDWENCQFNGDPFPCTPENVKRLLAFPVFEKTITYYSSTRALYAPEDPTPAKDQPVKDREAAV